jgi:DNA-binding IclR family transcriptional regulator
VGAVVHALQIMRCLAASAAPLGAAAVARATGISTSTCFNILRTLTRAWFASFNPADKTCRLILRSPSWRPGWWRPAMPN